MLNKPGILLLAATLFACSSQPEIRHPQKDAELLFIYDDGRMQFRDKYLNRDDVVIYADGYGGERAAVRLLVPSKPDYYRDSIKVKRISTDSVPIPDDNNKEIN